MTYPRVNKSVLDEKFEIRSMRLSNGKVKYASIRQLMEKLANNPTSEDVYAAANCIQILGYRLDAYRQPMVDAEIEYQSWFDKEVS